jgi:cob(I)alamin adenosyltransferase
MGYRLSKIYTRTGDQGTTGLGDGSRVEKDDLRIEAMGAVDELNSIIGVLLTKDLPDNCRKILTAVQHNLFDLGGEMSSPGHIVITPQHIEQLEQVLDKLNAELQPLREFILPGGTPAAAHAHHARTVCRRAERRLISLSKQQELNRDTIAYLNRLSDLLFVIARYVNKHQGVNDVLWQNSSKA